MRTVLLLGLCVALSACSNLTATELELTPTPPATPSADELQRGQLVLGYPVLYCETWAINLHRLFSPEKAVVKFTPADHGTWDNGVKSAVLEETWEESP